MFMMVYLKEKQNGNVRLGRYIFKVLFKIGHWHFVKKVRVK